jgi:sugar phosphate isomerase/epimerase
MTPLSADSLLSRGYMGDGHVDFDAVTRLVEAAGYTGDIEVEIFRQEIWDAPYGEVAARVVAAFDRAVAPALG